MYKRKRFSKHKKPPLGAWIAESDGVIYMGASKVDKTLILFLVVFGSPFFGFSIMWVLMEEGIPYISLGISFMLLAIIVVTSISKVRIWMTNEEIVIKNGFSNTRSIYLADVIKAEVSQYHKGRARYIPSFIPRPRFSDNLVKGKLLSLIIQGRGIMLYGGSDYKDVYKYYFRDIINTELKSRK